jgi:hypothetical protein
LELELFAFLTYKTFILFIIASHHGYLFTETVHSVLATQAFLY